LVSSVCAWSNVSSVCAWWSPFVADPCQTSGCSPPMIAQAIVLTCFIRRGGAQTFRLHVFQCVFVRKHFANILQTFSLQCFRNVSERFPNCLCKIVRFLSTNQMLQQEVRNVCAFSQRLNLGAEMFPQVRPCVELVGNCPAGGDDSECTKYKPGRFRFH